MELTKRENDLANLEEEYQQLPWLKLVHGSLFNYLRNNFIDRAELIKTSQAENHLYQLDYEESLDLRPAICEQEIHRGLKAKEGKFNFTVPFAAVVKDVELWGTYAVGFTPERKVILETTLDRVDCLEYSVIDTLKQGFNFQYLKPVSEACHIDLACSFVNYWSHLYAHWFLESLTRLEALENYIQKTGDKPVLIIDPHPPIWKIRSLNLMGYRLEDCIQWHGFRAKVNELIICSKRREDGRASVKACHWLRERILTNLYNDTSSNTTNITLNPNVFISRRKANARRIVNEEEVINTLDKLDFSTYVLEDLDWDTQVKIFAQAQFIVTPHGGGVTNIVFSQNINIIEIFGQKVSHFYYTIAQGLGFNYACMFCEAKGADIIINCDELGKLIHKMRKNLY
ncbi:MAG TPA: glycosyltransferase family 61 protein [Nostocaceae cyanobacterium]|nr:glycosyltransferase family 61 protein [Nostocaceae cyanobacterium]